MKHLLFSQSEDDAVSFVQGERGVGGVFGEELGVFRHGRGVGFEAGGH